MDYYYKFFLDNSVILTIIILTIVNIILLSTNIGIYYDNYFKPISKKLNKEDINNNIHIYNIDIAIFSIYILLCCLIAYFILIINNNDNYNDNDNSIYLSTENNIYIFSIYFVIILLNIIIIGYYTFKNNNEINIKKKEIDSLIIDNICMKFINCFYNNLKNEDSINSISYEQNKEIFINNFFKNNEYDSILCNDSDTDNDNILKILVSIMFYKNYINYDNQTIASCEFITKDLGYDNIYIYDNMKFNITYILPQLIIDEGKSYIDNISKKFNISLNDEDINKILKDYHNIADKLDDAIYYINKRKKNFNYTSLLHVFSLSIYIVLISLYIYILVFNKEDNIKASEILKNFFNPKILFMKKMVSIDCK